MPGDGAAIEIGITKAITAPFKILSFLLIGFVVMLVGRMAVDIWLLAKSNDDSLPSPALVVEREFARAAEAPDFMGSTHDRAMAWANFVTDWFYRKPGLLRHAEKDATRRGEVEHAVIRGVQSMNAAISQALAGSQILAIRAAILVSFLPWAGLLYALAIVDGLVERARRKVGGGRESSTLYHRAKYFQVTLATVTTTAYLWWPLDLDPAGIIGLTTLGCALLARLQAKYYKKHI